MMNTNDYPQRSSMDFEPLEDVIHPFDDEDDVEETPEEDNTKPSVHQVKIYLAASSGSLKTSYYAVIIEKEPTYKRIEVSGSLKGANLVYEATVKALVKALETAIENTKEYTKDVPVEFLIITNMDAITTGYYRWSKGWKVNGFTNAHGDRVNSHAEWRTILKLRDKHTIKMVKAFNTCPIMKSCKKKAQSLLATKR